MKRRSFLQLMLGTAAAVAVGKIEETHIVPPMEALPPPPLKESNLTKTFVVRRPGPFTAADPLGQRGGLQVYGTSKLAQEQFGKELSKRIVETRDTAIFEILKKGA